MEYVIKNYITSDKSRTTIVTCVKYGSYISRKRDIYVKQAILQFASFHYPIAELFVGKRYNLFVTIHRLRVSSYKRVGL